MDRERKRAILKDSAFIPLQIQGLKDRYDELLTTATHITAGYEGSGSSTHNNDSKIEKNVVKLTEISLKIAKLEAKYERINKSINELKPYHRFLIIQVDVKGKGIRRVAKETHRDPSSLTKTYNKALDSLKL